MSRYVARVVFESITEPEKRDERRNKATIANIVVGAPDLESLKAKVSQHIALVEDGGDIEQRITRG